jgi:protein-tyrosine phosphatase
MTQHNFGPAYAEEEIVYTAQRPGWDFHSVNADQVADWIAYMKEQGIERVCSLLPPEQLAFYEEDLLEQYRSAFGGENVCSAPIPDMHLVEPEMLHGKILPFLRQSERRGEKVVVHCSGGSGRAGHIISAWLVHARGFSVDEALSTVQRPRRNPLEAVMLENATMEELRRLLAGCRSE